MKTKTPKAQSSPVKPTPAARTGGTGSGNGKVHFALEGIQANEVFVAGDFNGWDPAATPLQHNGDGH